MFCFTINPERGWTWSCYTLVSFLARSLIPVYIGKFIQEFSVLKSLQFIVFMSISREVTTFESTSGVDSIKYCGAP